MSSSSPRKTPWRSAGYLRLIGRCRSPLTRWLRHYRLFSHDNLTAYGTVFGKLRFGEIANERIDSRLFADGRVCHRPPPESLPSGTVGGNGADVAGTVSEFRPTAAVPNFIAEEFNR
ncbi:MAG UNVERIFIED_CONTAM: hypothetical protein LVR18_02455 [Planctomycetaceae bacterium]